MRVWRMSLRRTKSAIISWAGSNLQTWEQGIRQDSTWNFVAKTKNKNNTRSTALERSWFTFSILECYSYCFLFLLEGEGENPGKFADDIVDSSDEGTNKYDWRDLARKLQSRRGDFNNNLKGKNIWHICRIISDDIVQMRANMWQALKFWALWRCNVDVTKREMKVTS